MLFLVGVGQPRRPPLPRRRPLRHPPRRSASTSRSATASTSASAPRSPGSKGRVALDEVLQAVPRVGGRLRRRQALADLDRARLGDAAGRARRDAPTRRPARRRYDSPRAPPAARPRRASASSPPAPSSCTASRSGTGGALTVARGRRARRRERAHGVPLLRRASASCATRCWPGSKPRPASTSRGCGSRTSPTSPRGSSSTCRRSRLESRTPRDPTLVAANRRQRDALARRGARRRPTTWPDADRTIAAAHARRAVERRVVRTARRRLGPRPDGRDPRRHVGHRSGRGRASATIVARAHEPAGRQEPAAADVTAAGTGRARSRSARRCAAPRRRGRRRARRRGSCGCWASSSRCAGSRPPT